MRVVRCDACGSKAMIAAGQCPKCNHQFELRDGFGELLPLAYCSSCESYYPAHIGQCKWCGTKPERPPILPQVLRGVAIAAAVIIVGFAWFLHGSASPEPQTPRLRRAAAEKAAQAQAKTDMTPVKTVVTATEAVPAPPPPIARADTTPVRDTAALAPQTVIPAAETTPTPMPAVASSAASDVAAKTPAKSTSAATTTGSRSVRWVRSVSRDWVIVRSKASKQARIVASIGPRSRVELGESAGTWRRIRGKGFSGWVEPRNLFEAVSPVSRRTASSARR
jgi:hypothetical protein